MLNRWIALALLPAVISLTSCAGGQGSAFVPSVAPNAGVASSAQRHRHVRVYVRMRIPRRDRHHAGRLSVHPATISPLTQSVTIAVNGGTAQTFNATRSSPGCSATPTGTLCTFGVSAPPGSDTFVVSTYNAIAAGGTILDRGTAVVNVVAGHANSFQITLGPVVSNAGDSGIGSLRYAVDNASPNDTIIFELPSNSTIALASVITPNVSLSIAGPGVTASLRHRVNRHGVSSNTTYSGVAIDGGSLVQIFDIPINVTVAISGVVLSNGAALLGPGGAIGNYGTLTLADDAIIDSVSPEIARHREPVPLSAHARRPHCIANAEDGGGVYNDGSLTVTDSTFDGNVVTDNCQNAGSAGGAIFNGGLGVSTLTVTGSTFVNNLGEKGGAVFNEAPTAPIFDHDTFVGNGGCGPLNGCASTGCTATFCNTYPYGLGAAIYDAGEVGMTVTNSTFTDNVDGGNYPASSGQGGALWLYGGAYTISNDTFTGNVAGGGSTSCSNGEGGAIYDSDQFSAGLELDSDTFSHNSAGGDDYGIGGAVLASESLRGSDDTFVDNSATGAGGLCTSSGQAGGGAARATAIVLGGSTLSGNTATANDTASGGAIAFTGNATIDNDAFTSNAATATGSGGASDAMALGGALDQSGSSTMILTNDTFTSNAASIGTGGTSAMGGALATSSTSEIVSSGDSFSANTASATKATGSTVAGGAVAAGSYFFSTGDTFKSNAALGSQTGEGGAAFVDGFFSVQSDSFTGNGVTSADNAFALGGALSVMMPGSIKASTFTANGASTTAGYAFGGAFFDEGGTKLEAVTMTKNAASNAGAGIFADAAETISGSNIDANAVTAGQLSFGGGGGIYGLGSLTISDTTIANNSVVTSTTTGGGGIYNGGGLELLDTTISGNAVTSTGSGSGGGGIFNQNNAALYNDTITGNTSNVDGGALVTYDPTNAYRVSLVNVTLYQNKATQDGGNVYNPTPYSNNPPSELTLYNSIIAGGSAAMGPDIYNVTQETASDDYNIIGSAPPYGPGGLLLGIHDKTATDPRLLALTNNGGPTFTLADQSSSPGKQMIPFFSPGTCGNINGVSLDQRGYTRGAGGFCDVGAYEFGGVASDGKSRAPKLHVTPAKSSAPPLHIPRVRVPDIPIQSVVTSPRRE